MQSTSLAIARAPATVGQCELNGRAENEAKAESQSDAGSTRPKGSDAPPHANSCPCRVVAQLLTN